MRKSGVEDLRRRVAKEAALLLYTMQEKEYKQAKLKAAKILGSRVLPSNLEVALELDRIAAEREGEERKRRLVEMRKEALRIMEALGRFHPRLVGSVWRGTARRNSDIDITVYTENPEEALDVLKSNGFQITRTEWQTITKNGEEKRYLHIYVASSTGNEAEIVVAPLQEMDARRKCEVYGDEITGLTIKQLKQVMKENPAQKFLPISEGLS